MNQTAILCPLEILNSKQIIITGNIHALKRDVGRNRKIAL